MSPQAYLDSVARVAAEIEPGSREVLLDVGCGSGILIPYLGRFVQQGGAYVGLDRLAAGIEAVSDKARQSEDPSSIQGLRADMTHGIPLRLGSIDTAVAHCSVYIIAEPHQRLDVYREIFRVLKPGGRFICVNPSTNYNARRIIRQSLVDQKGQVGFAGYALRRWIVYPLALWFGLLYVEEQLKTGKWKTFSQEEMSDEIRRAGFDIETTESVYADSAIFIMGIKP